MKVTITRRGVSISPTNGDFAYPPETSGALKADAERMASRFLSLYPECEEVTFKLH